MPKAAASDTHDLAARIRAGERRALAKAITLVESGKEADRAAGEALLTALLPETGRALRLGLSGAPGVGKSTFTESFGTHLTGQGLKVAVLAVDPSSARSGGSILGDKTRMEKLSRDPNAFIRPSPSGGTLGGVARRTREVMLLTEAAGYDVVLVETVGVGQSEIAVADMVDMFCLLLAPAGGDELQGIKRGIMELADLIIINKADGDLLPAARRAAADFKGALGLIQPKYKAWRPEVVMASSLEGTGILEIWEQAQAFRAEMAKTEGGESLRARQARAWLWSEIREGLVDALKGQQSIEKALEKAEKQVVDGLELPPAAARALLAEFLGRAKGPPRS
jgi:LAO/AO transport system kinase